MGIVSIAFDGIQYFHFITLWLKQMVDLIIDQDSQSLYYVM